MNEINTKKNLYGFGGWLVLFQIYIFLTLVESVQSLFGFAIMGSMFSGDFFKGLYGFNDFDLGRFFKLFNSPFVYVFTAVIFVLTLLVVIFFYRKKIIFRTLFIAQSVVSIVGGAFYYIYILGQIGTMFDNEFAEMGRVLMTSAGVMSLIPALGIPLALTIALFKSQRVKNTFGLMEA